MTKLPRQMQNVTWEKKKKKEKEKERKKLTCLNKEHFLKQPGLSRQPEAQERTEDRTRFQGRSGQR